VVHGVPNQEETASMGLEQSLRLSRIRDFLRIEAGAFILDHQQHASIGLAEASHINLLGWVLVIPVHNSIGECLSQGQFDLREMVFSTLHLTRERHDILDDPFERWYGGRNSFTETQG
jgi:hypothetical protein